MAIADKTSRSGPGRVASGAIRGRGGSPASVQLRGHDDPFVDDLVESNLGFVFKIANEYRNLGIPFEDLVSEGTVGLIHAATRFDATRGNSFISYAVWWIRKTILMALNQQRTLVRIPLSHRQKEKKIRNARQRLRHELGREPRREEIAKALAGEVADVDGVLLKCFRKVSLEHRIGENQETPLEACLVDESSPNPEDEFLHQEAHDRVLEALDLLRSTERTVIELRYGLANRPQMTLQEIADQLSLSRERIRQIEVQASKRLQRILRRERPLMPPRKPALSH